MELSDYLRILRMRWRIVAAVALVVVGVAMAVTMLTQPTYAARTQFFVSTSNASDTSQLAQGNTFTQSRVKSYAQLMTTPKFLDPVIEDLKLQMTSDQLARHVQTRIPPDTALLEVTVTDPSPDRAEAVAKSLAAVVPQTVDDLETAKGSNASPVKVTVVRDATLDPGPVSPRPLRNLALGGVLGLLLGLGAALLRDTLDTRVKTRADVERVADAALLGVVPFDAKAPEHPLVLRDSPHSPRSEAFRSIRTGLVFIEATQDRSSIVVTSSLPEEGKTTTAVNLALALADSGASVCLVEADLRRPRALEYLGLDGAVGVTDVLIGQVDLLDVLQPYGRTSLYCLGAGQTPPNPSELLGSAAMEKLLETLEERFDYVLLDCPPSLPVTDAAVLNGMVEATLLVVGAGMVSRDQLAHSIEKLRTVGGSLVGFVLNRAPVKGGDAFDAYPYDYAPESPRQRAKRAQA